MQTVHQAASITTPADNTIHVEIKSVYGVQTIYPACDKAELFARLAGTKSLTKQAIDTIKALGYTVQVVQQIISL